MIRLREDEEITIRDFPQLLEEGGFTYVWIYSADDYLKEELPKVMECSWEPAEKLPEGEDVDNEARAEEKSEEDKKTAAAAEDLIDGGRLYKVIYDDDGKAAGLEGVKAF